MRKGIGLAAALAVAAAGGAARAADPLIGTWVLDAKASTFPAGAQIPKAYTETYRLLPSGKVELVIKTVGQDGATSTDHFIFPAEGGAVEIGDGPSNVPGRSYAETHAGPNEWIMMVMANGVQQGTIRKLVSDDGRSRRDVGRFQTPKGLLERIEVFTRQ